MIVINSGSHWNAVFKKRRKERKEKKKGKKKKLLRKFQEAEYKELRGYHSTAGIREWKALYSLKWRNVY